MVAVLNWAYAGAAATSAATDSPVNAMRSARTPGFIFMQVSFYVFL
jgi:hypothetical protein